MKQISFALLAVGLLALPMGCTRQGAQEQEQQPEQESVIPGDEGTMGGGAQEDPAFGEQPQDQQQPLDQQEVIVPQEEQDPSMQPQDQQTDPGLQPQDQPADPGLQPQGQ